MASTNPAHVCLAKGQQYFLDSGRVGQRLEDAFYNRDMRVPPEVVFELALGMGLGEQDEEVVCKAMASKLSEASDRLARPYSNGLYEEEDDRQARQRRHERIGRLDKGVRFFLNPAPARTTMLNELRRFRQVVKIKEQSESQQLLNALPQPLLALPTPPEQQDALPQAVPLPAQQAALTTDAQFVAFLGQHIRPREDCARCVVARTDPSARTSFGDVSEVGNGRSRNMDLSRACPLAAHGVHKRQIAELLGSVSSLPPMAKRAKAAQFMQETHDVTPLGKDEGAKPFLVSLYNQDAGGQYEVAGRQTDFYQGFERF